MVAGEVQSLALKASEASKSTAILIENSLSAVEKGSTIADREAKILAEAVKGAEEVERFVNKITNFQVILGNVTTKILFWLICNMERDSSLRSE